MSDNLLYCSEGYVAVLNKGKDNEKEMFLGEDAPYQTFTDNVGELYRACVKQHGRCVGKVYVGDGIQVGWIFLKKNRDDVGVIETWVTVYTAPPVKRTVVEPGTYPTFKRKR